MHNYAVMPTAELADLAESLYRKTDFGPELRPNISARNAVGFVHRHVQVGSTVHTDEAGIYSRVFSYRPTDKGRAAVKIARRVKREAKKEAQDDRESSR